MHTATDIDQVFVAYGRAAYYAQLLEYDLVSIWILESITQGVSLTQRDLKRFQGEWSRKTLGWLLAPLKRSSLIPEDLKEFLEAIRTTRNTLAHDYFLTEDCDLRSSGSRGKAKTRLEGMGAVLAKGHELFRNVLADLGRDFGIDHDAILKELMDSVGEDAEQADERD